MAIEIRALDPASGPAATMVAALDRYLLDLYPVESNHLDSIAELSKPYVRFLAAFDSDRAIGCGAVKLLNAGYAEVKRVFVDSGARGRGVGRLVLSALERHAAQAGYTVLRLETGVRQPAALRLFERSGYARIDRFGPYPEDPLSIFMEKVLADPGRE